MKWAFMECGGNPAVVGDAALDEARSVTLSERHVLGGTVPVLWRCGNPHTSDASYEKLQRAGALHNLAAFQTFSVRR